MNDILIIILIVKIFSSNKVNEILKKLKVSGNYSI